MIITQESFKAKFQTTVIIPKHILAGDTDGFSHEKKNLSDPRQPPLEAEIH